jgi:O-antigen/teichoic acid export membrane protein
MTALRNAYLPQWAATLGVAAVSTALTFALGRVLGPEGFGIFSYALALASLWAILQDGGFRCLLQRESASPSPSLADMAPRLPSLALGQAGLVTALGLGLVLALPLPDPGAVAAAVVCLGLAVTGGFVSAILRGGGKFRQDAAWQMQVRLITALALAAALAMGIRQPEWLLLIWAGGLALALGLPPAHPLRTMPRFFMPRGILGPCMAFAAIEAATQIYFRSDLALLRFLGRPAAEIGRYAAAYRVVEGAALLLSPLGIIWFRDLRLLCNEPGRFAAALARRLGLLALGSAAALALLMPAGPALIHLAFGPGFDDPLLVRWLCSVLLFMAPNTLLTQAGIALGAERAYAFAAWSAALLNVGLNLALIPSHGGLGAAWATLAAEAALFAGLCLVLWRRLDHRYRGQP